MVARCRVVAGWRYGAFRVVGLEFHSGTTNIDPMALAPQLARLEYLRFIKMPQSTADDAAQWDDRLPDRLAVFHCPSHAPPKHEWGSLR